MGFSKKVVSRIKNEYAEKYREAQATADRRRDELHAKIAGIDVIDRELTRVGIRIFEATMSGKNVSEKIDDIKKDSELLLEKRPGDTVALSVTRDGTPFTSSVTLSEEA